MALLQISEPGLSAAPHQRRLAAGIDLGTTNSLVATVRSGQAETLADHEGRHLLPSVVHYQQQGHSVGYDARTNAALDTANTISSVKRLMGRSLADIQQRYPHLPYQFQASENGLPMIETAAGLLTALPGAILLDDTGKDVIESVYSSFSFDNTRAAALAMKHFLSSGHRRIALVSGPKEHFFTREIETGYRDSLSGAGIQADESLICYTDFTAAAAANAVESLLKRNVKFDAVFTNDEMAGGVYRALLKRGIRIPEDVALIIDSVDIYLKCVGAFFIPLTIVNIYRNGIQGLGYGLLPMMAGVAELIGRGVVAVIAARQHSYLGVCLASPAAWVLAAALLLVMYFYIVKFDLKKIISRREKE